jgi:hypothetical protein
MLPSLGLASDPAGKVVFYIKVVGEERNGLSREGDSRVGDQFALLEKPDGTMFVHEVEANHSMYAEREGLDVTTPVDATRIRHLFREADLAGFDFKAQLLAADEEEKTKRGRAAQISGGVGGTTVEVFCDFEGANFKFVCPGFQYVLNYKARYNAELARLLALLEDLRVFRPIRYTFTE